MFSNSVKDKEAKYRAILVAFKDLPKEIETNLSYHFVSVVNKSTDIRDHERCGDYKTSLGLNYRTCLYHTWFTKAMEAKLKEGYSLGIVEMRVDSTGIQESKLKKLEEENEGKILLVEEAKL